MSTLKEAQEVAKSLIDTSKPRTYTDKEIDFLYEDVKYSTLTIINSEIIETSKKLVTTNNLPKEEDLLSLKLSINKYFKLNKQLWLFGLFKSLNQLSFSFRNLFIITGVVFALGIISTGFTSTEKLFSNINIDLLKAFFLASLVGFFFCYIFGFLVDFLCQQSYEYIKGQKRKNSLKETLSTNKLADSQIEYVASVKNILNEEQNNDEVPDQADPAGEIDEPEVEAN